LTGELPRNALDVAGQKASAAIASGGTLAAGAGTYFELLPAILGSLASLTGIVISLCLFRLAWKKSRLERQRLHLQIAVLEAKEAERNLLPH